MLETSPFFVYPNGFGEHLFQMFIVNGIYNFGFEMTKYRVHFQTRNENSSSDQIRDHLILGFESGLKDCFEELVGALLTEVAKMQSTITVDQIWEGPIGCPSE